MSALIFEVEYNVNIIQKKPRKKYAIVCPNLSLIVTPSGNITLGIKLIYKTAIEQEIAKIRELPLDKIFVTICI